MKLPYMQFYSGDWMKDPALRAVSSASRGLWIDMLCLMWESARRGYLVHPTGRPVTIEQLSRMTGNSVDETDGMLRELEDCGVVSRTGDGILYSRRMDRDERERTMTRERVRDFRQRQVTLVVTPPVTEQKHARTVSECVSDSGSSAQGGAGGNEISPAMRSHGFPEAWQRYREYRADRGEALTPHTSRALMLKCERMGPARAVRVIEETIEKSRKNLLEDHELTYGPGGKSPAPAPAKPREPEKPPVWIGEVRAIVALFAKPGAEDELRARVLALPDDARSYLLHYADLSVERKNQLNQLMKLSTAKG